jgi:hypothetical protein
MRYFTASLLAAVLAGSAALADDQAQPTPPSTWALSKTETYTILLANWSSDSTTFIYRVCDTGGVAVRISTTVISGQPVTLAKGQCVDIATQGSLRLTRADATGSNDATGTYQFINAIRDRTS